jgi:hypothetical protein
MRNPWRLIAVLVGIATVSGCQLPSAAPGGRSPPPSQQVGRQPVRPQVKPQGVVAARGSAPTQAEFEIHLDRAAMAANRVDAAAVTDALSRFFSTMPFFSLIDLQDVKVRAADGRDISLRTIGTVDVWFGPAKTEIIVGGK